MTEVIRPAKAIGFRRQLILPPEGRPGKSALQVGAVRTLFEIERFADTDAGYQRAADTWRALTREDRRKRNQWLPLLKWIVIVAAAMWAGANVISTSIFYLNRFEAFQGGFRDLSASGFYEVMQVISTVGYSFTVGASAIYLVLWLEARRER